MRIGIDGRELCGRPTGVGRYLSGLLTEWCRHPANTEHEFVLYSHEPTGAPNASAFLRPRILPGRPGTWWEQVRLPAAAAEDGLNVFFAPGYTAPLGLKVPTVAAIHDVSFAAHPEWFTTREGMRRRWLAARTASAARVVITISEFSRRELVEHLGVTPSKIRVIPPGVQPPSGGTTPRHDARLLYVGSIFNRRHVPELIRAFAPIARGPRQAFLDIVGDNRTYPRQDLAAVIEREGVTSCVRWRQYVADEELGTMYGSARAFAFLSDYEGLGLPPLEALAAGAPPVLLETPVARESCGEAALYVDRTDLPLVTAALERLLFDEPTRRRLLDEAPAVLARYRWPSAASETLAVLEVAGS
jgi:alpha-1,3-rhamnosyl/mannosyltransferase